MFPFRYYGGMAALTGIDSFVTSGFSDARKRAGKSQEDVAGYMSTLGFGWRASTVSKIERGERRLTAGEAVAVAQYFDTTVERMAGMDVTPNARVRELDDEVAQVLTAMSNLADMEREARSMQSYLIKEVAKFLANQDNVDSFDNQFAVNDRENQLVTRLLAFVMDNTRLGTTYQDLISDAFEDKGIQQYIAFSRHDDELLTIAPESARQQVYKFQAKGC